MKFKKRKKMKKLISFICSFCLLISALDPAFGSIAYEFPELEPPYFGPLMLDGSGGSVDETNWRSSNPLNSANQPDGRYAGYPGEFILGQRDTPYIIKNGSELAGLAALVNRGAFPAGQYIDIQGLTAADLAQTDPNNNNAYVYDQELCEPATIDLRPFDGSSNFNSANFDSKWEPIGTSTNPFTGYIYSTTNAEIINFTYNNNYELNNNLYYGLFGYNQGTIGLKPVGASGWGDGGFSVSAMEIATEEGSPRLLNLDSTTIATFGGVVAFNSGTVNAITFTGVIILPATIAPVTAPCKFGGLVGENTGTGTITKCKFTDSVETQSFIGWTQNSANTAHVRIFSSTDVYAFNLGGVVGSSSSSALNTINECESYADIELPRTNLTTRTPSIAGGIVGSSTGSAIKNCNYYGDILSKGETVSSTSLTTVNGIGGIVGYSTGLISYCTANSNILFDLNAINHVNSNIKVGGIVGFKSTTSISYCVFMGSISTTPNSATGAYCAASSCFGGIAGHTSNTGAAVNNCISAADIKRYTIADGGGTGGIVGNSSSEIKYCFTMGYILGNDQTGGICGFANLSSGTSFTYNYSTASVDCNPTASMNLLRIGGLFGRTQNSNDIANSYFAGGALKSCISSIIDITTRATALSNTTFYDACVSPHGANASGSLPTTSDPYAKDTTTLMSAYSGNPSNWTTTASNYPQLKWAADIDGDANASAQFKSIVKALSDISTKIYVNINDTNTIKNDNANTNKLLNAYQLDNIQDSAGYLNDPAFTVTNGTAMGGVWAAIETYNNSAYSSTAAGFLWEKNITLTINGMQYKNIKFQRKAIEAANKTEGQATYITNANFFKFLSMFTTASGAYTGGEYSITEDINLSSTSITNMIPEKNHFCSRLIGYDHTISNITLDNNGYALFGNMNKRGYADDLKIDTATIGTASSPFTTTNNRIGLFFGLSYNSRLENLDVSNVTMYYKNLTSAPEVGLVAATVSTSSGTFTGCDVDNVYFEIGEYLAGTTSTSRSRIGNTGAVFGSVYNTNIDNCTAKNINMYFRIYETSSATAGIGCFTGRAYANQNVSINNCSAYGNIEFANTFATDRSYCGGLAGTIQRYSCSNSSFVGNIKNGGFVGGIAAYFDSVATISNCYVIGDITSQPQRSTHYAGGIAGRVYTATTDITNCYFMGNIRAPLTGGVIGNADRASLNNCYANAIVYANGLTSSTCAGGLVGQKTSPNPLNIANSYFTGQVQGGGNSGGLVGIETETTTQISAPSNSFYDRGTAGRSLFTVGNIVNSFPGCGKDTLEITATQMGAGFVQPNPDTNYPQLAVFPVAAGNHADYSTRMVFKNDDESYLLGEPSFYLNEAAGVVSVAKNETQQGTDPITLYDWRDIMVFADSKYSLSASGNTLFTANFENIPDYKTATFATGNAPVVNVGTIELPYQIICKPFQFGFGTISSPYIIYDLYELIKFKRFLDAGFDKSGIYYKIGSVVFDEYEQGTVVGDPITIDLAMQDGNPETMDEWQPILNFAGNLDGNNSVIKNLNCMQGITPVGSTDSYYGLFGTCAASAVCTNLTISNANSSAAIYCSKNSSKIGTLVAEASGGTFSGIKIEDVTITTDRPTGTTCYIGGIVGSATGGGQTALNISHCTAVITAKSTANAAQTNTSNYAGGIVGYLTGINASIQNCTTYGTISNVYAGGGIVSMLATSGKLDIVNCGSTVEITTLINNPYLGGIVGRINGITNMTSDYLKITNGFYGGRLEYTGTGTAPYIGSLVSACNKPAYVLNDSLSAFPTQQDAIDYINTNVLVLADTPENQGIRNYFDTLNQSLFENCYYPYDLNRFNCVNTLAAITYYYISPTTGLATTATTSTYSSNQIGTTSLTAKSNVLEMTGLSGPSGFSTDTWTFEDGLYPRLSALVTSSDYSNTEIDDARFSDEILFYSLAIHYTNAGTYGDKTFSNIFIRYEDAAFISVSSSDLVRTYNALMIQAKSTASSAINETLAWTSDSSSGGTYTKTINFIPSTDACGIADYSFFFANPEGMWVNSATDGEVTVKYPWSIHTADQLNGLAAFINGEVDSNGLYVTSPDFTPEVTGVDVTLGETFVLGADIDANYYTSFRPIGTQLIPFTHSFNGRGYVISNLHLNSNNEDYTELGLFGTVSGGTISNVGIVSGEIGILPITVTAGAIVASLYQNSSVIGCFSSIPITGEGDGTYVGGLVGQTDSVSNVVRASFNTGYIFITGENTDAGGIVGRANSTTIRNCYSAGYLEAGDYGAIYTGTATMINCYYDVNACGQIENTNSAVNKIPTAGDLDMTVFKAYQSGVYYPLQTIFFLGGATPNTRANAAIVPILVGDARSVTAGSLNVPGATMNYIPSSFQGRVADENGTVNDSTPSFTSFTIASTGLAILRVNNGTAQRDFIINLQCWYDKGLPTGNFTINTAKELAEFAAIVNNTLTAENNANGRHTHEVLPDDFSGKTVRLGSNIDLSELGVRPWETIGTEARPFRGIFDGDGHTVSNISITVPDGGGNAALFGVIDSAEITDLGVNAGAIDCAATYSAGIVAKALGESTIAGCFSSVTISGDSSSGGIAGVTSGNTTISHCYNMGQISSSANVGGITASNGGVVEYSYNVGVITTSATAAGIAAQNSGAVNNCYNAAFINGFTIYPISVGSVSSSGYDPKMLGDVTAVSGVSNQINFTANATWESGTDTRYPELKFFKDNPSAVMQDASELSVLKLSFGSGSYNEFISASVPSSITTNSFPGEVYLTQSVLAEVFSIVLNGDTWSVEPIDVGASKIIASTNNSGVAFEHQYYVIAVITMKIRYKFDFSELIRENTVLNPDYHDGLFSSTNTWNAAQSKVYISTVADFLSFIDYVNAGGITTGKRFVLNYNIDMVGVPIQTIGSDAHPFKGVFDGNGYTISNLTVNSPGVSALFGYLDSTSKVQNLTLDNYLVTASKTNKDMYVACIAAVNKGSIINVGITRGLINANNINFNYRTYLGSLAAYNMGKIKGCYFIQKQDVGKEGIKHYSKVSDYVGGLVGMNAGTITGCYLVSDMYNDSIDGIAGDNDGRTDSIINCYFNTNNGDNPPINITYAYDDVPFNNYFVPESMMKTEEFVKFLNSNLYAGTYERGTSAEFIGGSGGTIINDGFPYLANNQLVRYDISSYFGNNASMVLSVWNLEEIGNLVTASSDFTNGVFALDNLDFKYFSNIITNDKLQFNMILLPYYMDYSISSRVYGKNTLFNADISTVTHSINPGNTAVKDITAYNEDANGAYTVNETAYNNIIKPNLIVVDISFSYDESAAVPWGVYRAWSSSANGY